MRLGWICSALLVQSCCNYQSSPPFLARANLEAVTIGEFDLSFALPPDRCF